MIKRLLFSLMIIALIAAGSRAQTVDVAVFHDNLAQCDTAGWITPTLTVVNTGGVPIIGGAPIICGYIINGGVPVQESIDIVNTLQPGDTAVLTHTIPFHFNQYTTYNCVAFIDYLGDAVISNDTIDYTHTFNTLPGYGVHSNDTAVCPGSPATLMMELTGNGPWSITFAMGTDTVPGLPVPTSTIETEVNLDNTMVFSLLDITDVNGCYSYIGQSITITVSPVPEIDLGNDTILCAGQPLLLDAGFPGSTYSWWNGDSDQILTLDTTDFPGLVNQPVWVIVDVNGCAGADTLLVTWEICPDGLAESPVETGSLSPNPSNGRFFINTGQLSGTLACDIFSHTGQKVHSEIFQTNAPNSQLICHPGSLSKGLYHVVLHNQNQRIVHSLIIE